MWGIAYKDGYRYQLQEGYSLEISIRPAAAVANDYIALDPQGALRIAKGYAWDGPSGPTLDTRNFMRGSLVHDALYQLMREGLLDHTIHREAADYSGYWRQAVLWQPDCMIGDPGLQSQIASAMRTYGVQPASGDD